MGILCIVIEGGERLWRTNTLQVNLTRDFTAGLVSIEFLI
jgi:hypothetical protein